MSGDLFLKVVTEVLSPRNRNQSGTNGNFLQNAISTAFSPKNVCSPKASSEPTLAYQVISSFLQSRENQGDPSISNASQQSKSCTKYKSSCKKSKAVSESSVSSNTAIALGLTVVGGALLAYLMQKRIPELYSSTESKSLSVSPKKKKDLTNKGDDSNCQVCENPLSSEATTRLSCGHLLHTKCLYCCYVFFEVEKKEKVQCPVEGCAFPVAGYILDKIKDTKL